MAKGLGLVPAPLLVIADNANVSVHSHIGLSVVIKAEECLFLCNHSRNESTVEGYEVLEVDKNEIKPWPENTVGCRQRALLV